MNISNSSLSLFFATLVFVYSLLCIFSGDQAHMACAFACLILSNQYDFKDKMKL